MNDLERRLCISCLPGLNGLQLLAVSLTDITVSDILGFSGDAFVEFLVENGILRRAVLAGRVAFDPASVEHDARSLSRWLEHENRGAVFLGDPAYPRYLSMGHSPPYRLCHLGSVPPSESMTLSVAGTRNPTGFAVCECYRFGLDAALNGTGLVSALSRGCDQACAQGAVDAGGRCWALLPCGSDYLYPACPGLRDAMVQCGGGLLFPCLPSDMPMKWRFHQRNELLAGISPWLVLFQGGMSSGALLCADSALRQGREVAVHSCGVSESPSSRGTFSLTRDGAAVVDGYSGLARISAGVYPCEKSVRRVVSGGLSLRELRQGELSGALYRYRNAWYSSGYGQT